MNMQYPAYAPGHEPSGYAELKQRKPEVVWCVDPETGATHASSCLRVIRPPTEIPVVWWATFR